MAVPHGHRKTTTLIAGMDSSGAVAPFVIDTTVNRVIFEAWVEQALIEGAGARLLYLPPDSSDFNPMENLFAKIKALLRREAARTINTLWKAIGRIIERVTPRECQNMFAEPEYDADRWD